MNVEEARQELEAIAAGWEALYAASWWLDGTDCFWCCGGGDERRAELEERKAAVLAEHPELGLAP